MFVSTCIVIRDSSWNRGGCYLNNRFNTPTLLCYLPMSTHGLIFSSEYMSLYCFAVDDVSREVIVPFVVTGYIVDYHCLIITLLPFFIEMLQYDWLWSGHMIIKEMFHIPMKLKSELTRASMTTSDVSNQWRSNFQQQII